MIMRQATKLFVASLLAPVILGQSASRALSVYPRVARRNLRRQQDMNGSGRGVGCGHGQSNCQGGGKGRGQGRGQGRQAEMSVIHKLRDHRSSIQRNIQVDGETYNMNTTSEDPAVAGWIQLHVQQMEHLFNTNQRIRQWDPLFVDMFDHAKDNVNTTFENIDGGIRAQMTGLSPCGHGLVSEHAKAVSGFIATGELCKEHPGVRACNQHSISTSTGGTQT